MNKAAQYAGKEIVDNLEIVPIEVQAGGISFHRGETWHGSGKNPSTNKGLIASISLPLSSSRNSLLIHKERISLVVHLIPSNAEFRPTGVGYIYGRYKLYGSTHMEETFFPIIYREDGYRSPMLNDYCVDALV